MAITYVNNNINMIFSDISVSALEALRDALYKYSTTTTTTISYCFATDLSSIPASVSKHSGSQSVVERNALRMIGSAGNQYVPELCSAPSSGCHSVPKSIIQSFSCGGGGGSARPRCLRQIERKQFEARGRIR